VYTDKVFFAKSEKTVAGTPKIWGESFKLIFEVGKVFLV